MGVHVLPSIMYIGVHPSAFFAGGRIQLAFNMNVHASLYIRSISERTDDTCIGRTTAGYWSERVHPTTRDNTGTHRKSRYGCAKAAAPEHGHNSMKQPRCLGMSAPPLTVAISEPNTQQQRPTECLPSYHPTRTTTWRVSKNNVTLFPPWGVVCKCVPGMQVKRKNVLQQMIKTTSPTTDFECNLRNCAQNGRNFPVC